MKIRLPLLAVAAVLLLSVSGTAQSRIRPRPQPVRQTELNKGTSQLGSVARTLLLQQRQGSQLGSIARCAALHGGTVNYMRGDKRIHPPRSAVRSSTR